MPGTVIDRRLNQGNKSGINRQRFLSRSKEQIKDAVKRSISGKNIKDIGNNEDVNINSKDISEPTFHNDPRSGTHDRVLPGNKEYEVHDLISKPEGESKGNGGRQGGLGDDIDDFLFTLSRDEFLEYLFDDLELPDFAKETMRVTDTTKYSRAGFTSTGTPANLNILKTFKNSIGRRFALSRPTEEEIEQAYQNYLDETEPTNKADLFEVWEALVARTKRVPFIEENDLKYNYYDKKPSPSSQAVMFCVDAETEYLTKEGWKKISQYQDGVEIAQYKNDGTIEFVVPKHYIVNERNQKFLQLSGEGFFQRITPEHRFIYKQGGEIKECLAKEIESLNYGRGDKKVQVITSFKYSGEGIPLSDFEIRLRVAFMADGTYQQEKTNRAQMGFIKNRKIERLEWLLSSLNIKYNKQFYESRNTTAFYFSTEKRYEKRFPKSWYNASKKQLEIIAEEVIHWDGNAVRRGYSSKYKEDVDFIQFVFASLGYGTNMLYSSGVWCVNCFSRNLRSITNNTKFIHQDSPMENSYCFSVDSEMLVLRRNEHIFITGNCIMDVSGSMGPKEKDIAKRFFLLLYLFLERQYDKIDIKFIRHTEVAEEVDEQTFFYDKKSGGTLISSALDLTSNIIKERYNQQDWNIYISQVTDGDNTTSDNAICDEILTEELLPVVQYFAYIQVEELLRGPYNMFHQLYTAWPLYFRLSQEHKNLVCKKITDQTLVWTVFAELFKKVA